jgi:peptidoglycan/xylan/chitin deacetylase (PgdA/CDA1 family)
MKSNKILNINLIYIIIIIQLLSCSNAKEPVSNLLTEDSVEVILNKEVELIGLLYHRFNESKYPSTSISKELFRQQLSYLKKNKYEVLNFGDAILKLRSKEAQGRYIVITIDDAFKSFMEHGFPLLKEFGFPATLFINTETVGSGDYLTWNDLKILAENNIEIGNHTHSHDYFLDLDSASRKQAFLEDVELAQQLIKSNLSLNPSVFAFPYGEFDEGMIEVIKKMGFIGAAAQNSGVISSYSDLFALPRFPMTDHYGKLKSFTEKISMKALPVIRTNPSSTISQINPPVLKIILDHVELDFNQLQCFVQGGNCNITQSVNEPFTIQITSDQKLASRRHLYTVTIPNKDNSQWYWYSHQWVFPATK